MKQILFFLFLFLALLPVRSQRPTERCFTSPSVEQTIADIASRIADPVLRNMFVQCLPNTLDTTVRPDGYIITGDIDALWLRDSSAQVWPYLRFLRRDDHLRQLVASLLLRQFRCLVLDPYANAFYADTLAPASPWTKDYTAMRRGVHERKWELDSPMYVLRLACGYYEASGDPTLLRDTLWTAAVETVLRTLREQQRRDGWDRSPYRFMRRTHAMHDTQSNSGYGHPGRPCGLVASSFRPSDDCTLFPYLVPSNFMAADVLKKTARLLADVTCRPDLAAECVAIAAEIEAGLKTHATVYHPKYGTIYAFEVDGFGSALLMDDANIPSLLALPYIGGVSPADSVYCNTRRFVWSDDNPYFFRGPAGEGIGGPHEGLGYIWPMSIIVRALTSTDDAEIRDCLRSLARTTAGTGFMHEAYRQEDASHFTRSWFAWANTLFGELILHLDEQHKLHLVNSSDTP
ncbi:MAG: glycoside hydrolase family 125 protein [Prevotellaceae bacterium]|nr:glycoside hydrolase family 125 protein [Prevotellaceae bacterium]